MQEIAVTGIGVVSAAGWGVRELKGALFGSWDGLRRISAFPTDGFKSSLAGEVPGLETGQSERDRFMAMGRASLGEAIAASGAEWAPGGKDVALVLGTTQGSGAGRNPPRLGYLYAEANELAEIHGIMGPRIVVSTACTASSNAIIQACGLLLEDQVSVAIAGGVDVLSASTFSGFSAMRSLDPAGCSPYARSGGLTIGEGAAFIVLERFESAAEPRTDFLASVLGWGQSSDAYHPTAPDPTGRGARLAMERALDSSGMCIDGIDYVNGHGTGTAANDGMERIALEGVFGRRIDSLAVSSTKAMTGHTLGAAGALEAAICVLSLQHGVIPETRNAVPSEVQAASRIDFVSGASRWGVLRSAMSVNFGFGGGNTAIILGAPHDARPQRGHRARRPFGVRLTGLGVRTHAASSLTEFVRQAWECQDRQSPATAQPSDLPEKLSGGHWRRMDRFSRSVVEVAIEALVDAGKAVPDMSESLALVLGTANGPIDTICGFNERIALRPHFADPVGFMNSSPSSAIGYLSLALHSHGPTTTVVSGGTSGIAALDVGARYIRSGTADEVVVVVADLMNEAFDKATDAVTNDGSIMPSGSDSSGGWYAFVLERDKVSCSNSAPYCTLRRAGFAAHSGAGDNAWVDPLNHALFLSGIESGEVDFYAAGASGLEQWDRAEARTIESVFGENRIQPFIGTPSVMTRSLSSGSGALNTLVAAIAIRMQVLPRSPSSPNPIRPLHFVGSSAMETGIHNAVAAAHDAFGSYGCLVLTS